MFSLTTPFKKVSSFSRLQLAHSLSSYTPSDLSFLLQGHIPESHLLQIHAQIIKLGAHQDNLISTRLIGHCKSQCALKVFSEIEFPNIFPCNALIRVLAEEGLSSQALSIFKVLKFKSILPNGFTFSFLLKACSRSKCEIYVKQVHTHIVQMGFVCDSVVSNGLLLVYAKVLRDLVSGFKMFDEMPERDMVCCWTSLIAGCAQSGRFEEALRIFVSMVRNTLKPENDTMVSVLSACSHLKIVEIEKWVMLLSELIDEVESKNGKIDDSVNTVLVYLYGKLGRVDRSRERFDQVGHDGKRSVIVWNAVINAYVQNGFLMEAIKLFHIMVDDCTCRPNHVTMVSVLSACAQIGDLDLGRRVHEYIMYKGREGVLGQNTFLATALIDMYSKCGSLDRAREVFKQIFSKDVVSFNAMIMGLATNGEGEEALTLFSKMLESGMHPNAETFLGVLCACSHSGLTEKGCKIFQDMGLLFSVSPGLEHYACYIDLLARRGLVEEALEVVNFMPFEPNGFVWGALLQSCLLHSKVDLAQDISKRLVKIDPNNSGGYVLLSNALAGDQQWANVSWLRSLMRAKGIRKQPGHSWISINGIVQEFLSGSVSHPKIEGIYHTLDRLVKEMKVVNSSVVALACSSYHIAEKHSETVQELLIQDCS
ncbi:Pentatricopeptide repeat [Dillenia turbinata]|uniref:Pentatricopeptide repeat n=1 Tax=Dillenia turbinata TaxID=194707 RepID=A0AAN8WDP9_9MAGN